MKSLLLVAHGSRREESNTEIGLVAASLRARMDKRFSMTEHAFLELAEPSIPDAIDQMIAGGADEIIILPYFLSAGRHVHEDIPSIVEAKRHQHENVKLIMAPYLGEASEMIEVLASLSQQVDGD